MPRTEMRPAAESLGRRIRELEAQLENLRREAGFRAAPPSFDGISLDSESILMGVINGTSDIVYVKDLDGRYLLLNTAAEEITGKSATQTIGNDDFFLFSAADAAMIREHDRRMLRTGTTCTYEEQVADASGTTRTFLTTKGPLYSLQGQIVALFGISRDISERKRAETKLQEAMQTAENEKRRSEGIIAALGEGISIVDTDFRVIFQNKAHIDHIGEHQGKICHEAFLRQPERCDHCPVALAFDDGGIHTLEKTLLIDGAPLSLAITASPLRDASGKIVAGIELVRDMTERRLAEQKIVELNTELEQRARDLAASNSDLKAFSSSLSHDLKTPLSAIFTSTELLAEHLGDTDEEIMFHLANISRGCEKICGTIDAMLVLSRVARTEISSTRVDIGALAQDILLELQLSDAGREVELVVQPHLEVFADPQLLRRAMENLLTNAWKYTSRTVKARIEVGGRCEEGMCTCFVRDNGAGFDMKNAGRLFEPFERLHDKEEFEGTGLGLTIVHRVVTRHGGKIRAEGAPGKGATFIFTLPQPGSKEDATGSPCPS